MITVVVDASVVAKWLVPEELSAEAARLLEPGFELHAPHHLLAEVGNILWKKHRKGELSAEETDQAVLLLTALPVELHVLEPLLPQALNLARAHNRTVYDSLYLALGMALQARLVTADERLVNALRATAVAPWAIWLGAADWRL